MSYVLPTALGLVRLRPPLDDDGAVAPRRAGTARWPRSACSGCLALIVIGMQPPNEKSVWIVGGVLLLLGVIWGAGIKDRFQGPPEALMQGAASPVAQRRAS